MNVNETVRESITSFPSLFSSAADVMYHIFCVIGNGYDWTNGEAVSIFAYEDKPWTAEQERARHTERWGSSSVAYVFEDMIQENIRNYQHIVDTVDERIDNWNFESYLTPESKFYPQSSYALLMNLPENIAPDWAEAAAKMKIIATQNGWKF